MERPSYFIQIDFWLIMTVQHKFVDFNEKLNPPIELLHLFLGNKELIKRWREIHNDKAFESFCELACQAYRDKDWKTREKYFALLRRFLKSSKANRTRGFLYWYVSSV